VEEKVDGSQFSFGKFGGELQFYSKNARVYPEAAGMFAKGVEAISSLSVFMQEGWLYRGEYLQKPKHNVLAYDRVPANHVILFDVTTGPETFLSREDKQAVAEKLGLEIVPSIVVDVTNMDALMAAMDRVSCLGGQKMEGLVFKNYTRFGRDSKPLFGKYVSEAFREIHGAEWKAANPTRSDILQTLIQAHRTPARWNKAVQHLREEGKLTQTPKDIGPLIKEVQRDVFAECTEDIKEALFKWAQGQISRGVIAGLPEFYKQELARSQFEASDGQAAAV
jgi:hypothetical protein